MEARYCARSSLQSNVLKHMIFSPLLVNSEVCLLIDVRGANINYEVWKTHITSVLKQGTLVEDDTINRSGYNAMQASDGSVNLPANKKRL